MALNNLSSAATSPNATATNVNNAAANLNNDTLNALAGGTANAVTSTPQSVNPNENLVVRIDENSADNLQAMFDILNQKERPLQKPFIMRNLPASFFNPPSTGSKSPSVSHTRENSVDSAFGSGTTTICSPNGSNAANNIATGASKLNGNAANATTAIINPLTSRLQISHSRAHSSPASLQQTYAGLNAQTNTNPIVAQQVNHKNLFDSNFLLLSYFLFKYLEAFPILGVNSVFSPQETVFIRTKFWLAICHNRFLR